jgi:hypothetical protein
LAERLVVETGKTQSTESLEETARWWLSTGGELTAYVILFDIDTASKTITDNNFLISNPQTHSGNTEPRTTTGFTTYSWSQSHSGFGLGGYLSRMPGPILSAGAKFARRRKPDKNRILERTDIGYLRTDIMDLKKEVTGLNEGVARCMVGMKYLHRSSYTIQNGNRQCKMS